MLAQRVAPGGRGETRGETWTRSDKDGEAKLSRDAVAAVFRGARRPARDVRPLRFGNTCPAFSLVQRANRTVHQAAGGCRSSSNGIEGGQVDDDAADAMARRGTSARNDDAGRCDENRRGWGVAAVGAVQVS